MENGSKNFTIKLEKVNSYLHAMGVIFGLISMPVLITQAGEDGNPTNFNEVVIYATCFLMVFIASTLSHGFQQPQVKNILKIVDHISIYFLIAGTYTPLILIYVNNNFGITLLVILWGLTLFGIFFKIFYTGRHEILSTLLYVLMGWILFADYKTFFATMPYNVISLITIGGILYSLGVIFYLWQNIFIIMLSGICLCWQQPFVIMLQC